jgi:NAD-dependent DNA ligase
MEESTMARPLVIPKNVRVISFDDWKKINKREANATEACPSCGGTGEQYAGKVCQKCSGEKRVSIARRLYEEAIRRDLARLSAWMGAQKR